MGDSDKIKNPKIEDYSFENHYNFLKRFLESFNFSEPIILIIHDWGSALGFHWAKNNPEKVKGICYMESIVKPFKWKDWPEKSVSIFKNLRSEKGEEIILKKNIFIEHILPKSIIRELSDEEMNIYRLPYTGDNKNRLPMLAWPRLLPIEKKPYEIYKIVSDYSKWLLETDISKLCILGNPGAIMTDNILSFCKKFKNQDFGTVKGIHFLQEDSPKEISDLIFNWIKKIN